MSRLTVNARSPRAAAICDRCGFRYNHDQLAWQFDWRGPKLQNLYYLVCDDCLDVPQQNGQRTIILPPDPVPIRNARPEDYVSNNNPLSTIGGNASPQITAGSNIGSMESWGGVNAAFNGVVNKPSQLCACKVVSDSSFGSYVAKNWAGDVSGITEPSSLMARIIRHSLSSFTAYAPNDQSFLPAATEWVVQGSPVNTSLWGAWTTLSSGVTTGEAGESVSGTCTGGLYQFHRFALLGDGSNPALVAQVEFSVNEVGSTS